MSDRLCIIRPRDPPKGMTADEQRVIVLVAGDEEDAWQLVWGDPSVAAGVQTPELHPFRASLLAGRD